MNKLKKVVSSQGFVNLLSSVFSILAGLLFGFLLLRYWKKSGKIYY